MKDIFLEILNFRHACKIFDKDKSIKEEDMRFILDAGRKSPSSCGTQPWKFLVIQNQELKEEIQKLCWNQIQITSSSLLVIVLASIVNADVNSKIPEKIFNQKSKTKEEADKRLLFYTNYMQSIKETEGFLSWAEKQCYIAATNMMNAAASLKIDSCPIGGFEKEKLEKLLKLDITKHQISLVMPFGYRMKPQPDTSRLDFDEVVEFIK